MNAFVIDTSAIIAIINDEPEALSFVEKILSAGSVLISAASMHEANCVALRRSLDAGLDRISGLVRDLGIAIEPFDRVQLAVASRAYSDFGHGTGHPADLNMGDCFAYALAKTRDLPLLFKGDDFVHTDIAPAFAGN